MSGSDPQGQAHDDRDDRDDEARFAPPPEAGASTGEVTVGAGRAELALRGLQAVFVGAAIGWAAVQLGLALPGLWPLTFFQLAVPLGVAWALTGRARAPRRILRWDAWGLTEEVHGARTSIAWASARAWVGRDRRSVVVRVVDDAGRSIACGWGRDLPVWARGSVGRREDVEQVIAAAGALPRAEPPSLERPAMPHASAAISVLGAVLAIAIGPAHVTGLLAALVVLGIAVAPDLRSARALLRRAWVMRGARTVALARGRLAIARPDGSTIPLVTDEVPRDARLAEHGGESVRVKLARARDGGDPYRGRATVQATRIESIRERRARVAESSFIVLRTGVAALAMGALALAWLPPLPPPQRAEQPPMPSLAGPRPPQPTAWRSPPRAPILHRGMRASCERPGVSCRPVVTYYDEVGREVYRCGSWQRERCDLEMRDAIPDAVLQGE